MTQTVQINPGETLMINVSKPGQRPTLQPYSYDELIDLVSRGYRKKGVSRRSQSNGTLASRQISLLARGMRTGKWATGAVIDVAQAAGKLTLLLNELSPEDVHNLTKNAVTVLDEISTARYHSCAPLRAIANAIVEQVNESAG